MFRALGTTLVAGRDFTSSDREDGPQVVIVNRAMAQWLWPGRSALDKRIKLGGPTSRAPWMTVIGVASDLRRYALTDTTRPEMIVPYTQKPYPTFSTLQFAVRSRRPASQLMPEIQRAIAQVDPSVPASRVRTMEDLVSDASTSARFAAGFMAAFAGSALFLAMIGLYGVIAYSVLQRHQELGVRRALGASTAQIVQLVAREAGLLGAIGVAAGTVVALGAGVAMRSMLYGVSAFDAPTLAGTVVVLGAAAMAACVVPAWRATRVEPRVALEER
jgi:ABC-type antimicrobial peptide transport system permease subunit